MHFNMQHFNMQQHFKCMYRQKAVERVVIILILNFHINTSLFLFVLLTAR